jgi:hypothetical protein
MPEIIFKINLDTGDLEVEVEGVVGKACETTLQPILEDLGKPTTEQVKPEYHVQTQVKGIVKH